MAAKRKAAKRGAGAKGAARGKAAEGRARPAAGRAAAKVGAKRTAKALPAGVTARQVAPRTVLPPVPRPIGTGTLALVLIDPLRHEAAAALERGETVEMLAGITEEGGPVETLVLSPSGVGLQSSGIYVHRGTWSGSRLVTDKGHLLDLDGNCFCRDCETAGGYTVDDDE